MSVSTPATPSPREILARLHEFTLTDPAAAVDLYAEDGVHELPFAPAGAPRRLEGRGTIRALLDAQGDGPGPVTYTGFDNVVVWETTDPEVIIAEYEVLGTLTATGAPVRVANLMLLRVRDGRIVLTRSYFNPSQLAELMNLG